MLHSRPPPIVERVSCRRNARNGGDFSGKSKSRKQERVGSVGDNPDNLENSKETEGGAQGTQGISNNCTNREGVPHLLRQIRGFRNKYH